MKLALTETNSKLGDRTKFEIVVEAVLVDGNILKFTETKVFDVDETFTPDAIDHVRRRAKRLQMWLLSNSDKPKEYFYEHLEERHAFQLVD